MFTLKCVLDSGPLIESDSPAVWSPRNQKFGRFCSCERTLSGVTAAERSCSAAVSVLFTICSTISPRNRPPRTFSLHKVEADVETSLFCSVCDVNSFSGLKPILMFRICEEMRVLLEASGPFGERLPVKGDLVPVRSL